MRKFSISKKNAWSLILKINSCDFGNSKEIKIKENISGKDISLIYDIKKNIIKSSNLALDDELTSLFEIFLPIVCCKDKIQYIGHIAQSLDGYIATNSGESKYISGRENLEHIHRLRAISDIIIVGANTYLEDQPRLTTRLVDGKNPKIYIFDPKKIINKNKITEDSQIFSDISSFKKNIDTNNKIVYIEGGGKTISYFLDKKILDRIHVCLCPIILGGGRPSFIKNDVLDLNEMPTYKPVHHLMGKDVLFDIKI